MQNWGAPAYGKGKAQPVYGKANPVPARPAGPYGDRGNTGGGGSGDWDSPQWGSQQFAPMAAMMAMMMSGGFSGGKASQVKGDPKFLVYVANVDWKATWQELKDHMKQAGTVEFCSILTEDGTDWGRSKGMACVRYATEQDVANAIATLNQSDFKGRPIKVDHWTSKTASA
ncbi:PABN1 [Symbiodinium sp. CCMP2456]|nr:PABN1 [Symbiodinium sp. CCMP2456]